jgi:salicylate hydroxylase
MDITTTPSGRALINFSDGTTHETDLVIGADGIKSTTRRVVVGEKTVNQALVFTNTVCYRGLISMEKLKSMGLKTNVEYSPNFWMGLDKVSFLASHTLLYSH